MLRKKYTRRAFGPVEQDILSKLSAGDMLVGMLLSARSTKRMFVIASARAARRQARQRAIERLANKGLVVAGRETLHLTDKGKTALEGIVARLRLGVHENRSWDGKWRLIVFDIPEVARSARNALRLVLKRARFLKLQQSVWIYPHECDELNILLAQDKRLAGRVVYARVDKIDQEKLLLKHFKLARRSV